MQLAERVEDPEHLVAVVDLRGAAAGLGELEVEDEAPELRRRGRLAAAPTGTTALPPFAAGTPGVGPGGSAVRWDAGWVRPRGGVVGEALYWGTSSALGMVGSHVIALFLFVAAVLLLTGASVAGVIRATTTSVSSTTREMREAVRRRRATEELAALEATEPRVSRATPRVLSAPITWASTATAISAGLDALMSRPIGAWMRSISSAVAPAASRRSTRLACVFLLPSAPT